MPKNVQAKLPITFVYNTKRSYDSFLAKYAFLTKNDSVENKQNLRLSLDIVVSMAIESNLDLGCYFLRKIIRYNFHDFLPHNLFANRLNSALNAKRIMTTILSDDYELKSEWIIKYFECIPVSFLTKNDLTILLDTISGCSPGTSIYLVNLKKLKILDSNIIDIILIHIYSLNENGKKILLYDYDSDFIYNECSNREVIQNTYIQQVKFNRNYDYELKGLLLLLKNNPHFLVDYIKSVASEEKELDSNISQIWAIEGIEPTVEETLDILRSKSSYYIYRDAEWVSALFTNIKDGKERDKAKEFLKNQFNKSLGDRNFTEQIVLITRGIFKDLYDIFIRIYIESIKTPDDFFKIDWLNLRSGISVFGGNTTFGDIEAAKWSSLLSILESNTNPKVYAIKAHIKRKIVSCQKQADDERARRQLWR